MLSPYVREGMTVLEPGPGIGFFTIPLARLVGASGKVIAIDVQTKMIEELKRRAEKVNLLERIDARVTSPDTLGISDLESKVDFTLAFAMVHELPDAGISSAKWPVHRNHKRGCCWQNLADTWIGQSSRLSCPLLPLPGSAHRITPELQGASALCWLGTDSASVQFFGSLRIPALEKTSHTP